MQNSENDIREKLAIAHHVIAYYGWDELISTHLSARIPDTGAVLITPKNTAFNKVTPANLVLVDLDGEYLSQNGFTVLKQAANIHLEAYKARQDIHCMIHTHSMYSTIVSSLTSGFQFTNQNSLRFYNDIAYHAFNGLALDNEGAAIASNLADKRILFAQNHGVITTGSNVEETLYYHYHIEKCCEMLVKTLQCNQKIIAIPEQTCELTKAQFDRIKTPQIEFEYFAELVK